ncbi:hypothetical protein QWZ08_00100 [Ferruginibacter paludis]|uniref:hypothetical protein n=1 Tax=Ferruginibacter paludis TaxID=1310417 RepID=UPI0025B3BC49|nr:hypothetical protein [Ferruginibacter paludis]MDN3654001.1 hypothetical protein [Ferruginibacter paludis]
MALTKVLIAVKTYPSLSTKYDELVCTAGFLENGSWIRIFPIPFRKLEYDKRYSKYDWVEIDLTKNTVDFRPESYKPRSIENAFNVVGHVETHNNWKERKDIVLKKVYTNLTQLISEAKDKTIATSLATFKPAEILDFTLEQVEREWDKEKLAALKAKAQQLHLFQNAENPFDVVNKLPFKFSYRFKDDAGTISKLMIEDWEIGALYWKMLAKYDSHDRETKACEDVKKKYWDDFALTKDLHLFLGTVYESHVKNYPNPFVIIGTFHPTFPKPVKEEPQLKLF